MERVILHVDMDAFFASVEILDNPKLKNKPIAVGGDSGRGVVTTCSYAARKFGVRSAMPIHMAKTLCPELIIVPVRHFRYKEISEKIFNIFHTVSKKVEKVSIDESYIDITDLNQNPIKIALELKRKVKELTGLTLSVGISYNKFFAKIASDWNKPNGIMEIRKDNFKKILSDMPVSKIHGIGSKSIELLNGLGILTVKDMYTLSKEFFDVHFGKGGEEIYNRIRGIDNRQVEVTSGRKSYGKESTFSTDIYNKDIFFSKIKTFSNEIATYLKKENLKGKTLTIKFKTNDFEVHTKSKTIEKGLQKELDIYTLGIELFNSLDIAKPLRLLGLSISNLDDNQNNQLTLFDL